MKKIYSLIIGFGLTCSISSQDLIQRVQQGITTPVKPITAESSNLAQKFIHTNFSDLTVKDFFSVKPIDTERQVDINKNVADAILFDLNRTEFSTFAKASFQEQQIILRIPVDKDHYFDLLLEKAEDLDKNFRLHTSEDGHINFNADEGAFYNGIIAGIPESIATVSMSANRIEIIASDLSGNYVITEIKGSESEYIMFNDFKIKQNPNFSCGINDDDFVMPINLNPHPEASKKQVRDNVEVYIEVDYDIYVDHGMSTTETMNYVLDVFRASVSVFEKEQISLRLNKVLIWTTNNDRFNGISNFTDFDVALKAWACDGFTDADIGHYLGTTEGIGGLANSIGDFCDQNSGLFCIDDETAHCASLGMNKPFIELDAGATFTLGYSVPTWELYVFCHEMGHVFGSPHTHACAWNGNNTQIDDCGNLWSFNQGDPTVSCFNSASPIIPSNGGTMMSYCHLNAVDINLSLGFDSQAAGLMRTVIYNSSCIGTYELTCPDVETIESTIATNATFDAKKEILIHDATITTGFAPTFTGKERVDIYGEFQAPAGSGFRLTNTGCN